ncbi:MAG: peptide chain release factor N(5)-glutamine methyltransferase [Treponema sp.]|jgi:release factor glutamine methyltransferase|nr:peptide chain release factor N(5)-glutamine methyltransferase [Treponema sp.]
MTIREIFYRACVRLRDAGIETPVLDAGVLLAAVLHTDRAGLIIAGERTVSEEAQGAYTRALERRLGGECVAYIVGRKEFWGLDFTVTPDVLVPRPDTETLVEAALSHRATHRISGANGEILDLCTGSGSVAIALKHERPTSRVAASDISPAALAVARQNALRLLGDAEAIHLIESDLFNKIDGQFDLITANPPYVPSALIASLAPEVRGEPLLALDGGNDGLDLIRRIVSGAKPHLKPGGVLLMEADSGEMDAITRLLLAEGYEQPRLYYDAAGKARVIGTWQANE